MLKPELVLGTSDRTVLGIVVGFKFGTNDGSKLAAEEGVSVGARDHGNMLGFSDGAVDGVSLGWSDWS